MSQNSHQTPDASLDFLEFDSLRVCPSQASILRATDEATFPIRPKEQQLLLVLLRRLGETVTYKEVWAEVWPEIKDFQAVRHTMTETKSTLDKSLRDILESSEPIIETVKRQGYCLKPRVRNARTDLHRTEPSSQPPANDAAIPPGLDRAAGQPILDTNLGSIPARIAGEPTLPDGATTLWSATASMLATHPAHVLGSCGIYSLSYVCILVLEVSYKFDQFGSKALWLSPFVFFWIFITSLAAMALDWRLIGKGSSAALPIAILTVICAALILDLALNILFLPAFPITEATFQAHTAQGAYLKNVVLYFLPLAITFLVLPFHFVASLREQLADRDPSRTINSLRDESEVTGPKSAIYIQPRTLGWLLLAAGVICMFLTFKLLDNLKTGPYMNLFEVLVMFRLLLYFGLGSECLLWYSRTLEDLKSQ